MRGVPQGLIPTLMQAWVWIDLLTLLSYYTTNLKKRKEAAKKTAFFGMSPHFLWFFRAFYTTWKR